MEIIEFNLGNIPKKNAHDILNVICCNANKNELRFKFMLLGIPGRTKAVKLWSTETTWNSYNNPEELEEIEKTREEVFEKMLNAQSLEKWVLWYANDNLRYINNLCNRMGAKHVRFVAILNDESDET